MGMDYLREIGKRVILPIAIYKTLMFCEPNMDCYAANKSTQPAVQIVRPESERGYREINTIEELVNKLSPQEKAELERYERRFASKKSREAETAYWVFSPYIRDYEEAAKDFGLDPKLVVGQAAVENSNYKMILATSKRKGITPDQAYLSMESKAKAKGPFMIKKRTAQYEADMVVSKDIDYRTNPAEAARGAMKYLTGLMEEFGSIFLGLAAYNTGAGALRKHGVNRKYYLKTLALGLIYKNPEKYGITLQGREKGEDFTPPWIRKAMKRSLQKGKQAVQKNVPCKSVPYQVAYKK
jgi:soluble lytic murein transglycosylase-like protein